MIIPLKYNYVILYSWRKNHYRLYICNLVNYWNFRINPCCQYDIRQTKLYRTKILQVDKVDKVVEQEAILQLKITLLLNLAVEVPHFCQEAVADTLNLILKPAIFPEVAVVLIQEEDDVLVT